MDTSLASEYVALLIAPFLAGVFLCNAVPHIVAGLQGSPFPTPFARPRGVGHSSPLINFIWGTANLAVGLFALSRSLLIFGINIDTLAFFAGMLVIGTYLSVHFGKVRAGAKN